jgi:hypothetical protein
MRWLAVLRLVAVLPVLLLVLGLCGCASSNKGRIEGTKWAGKTVKGQSLPAGSVRIEFSKDGKVVYYVSPKTYTGTYELGMADYVTLNFDQEIMGRKSHVELILIKDKELTMVDSDGTTVVFTKI